MHKHFVALHSTAAFLRMLQGIVTGERSKTHRDTPLY